MPDRGSQLGRLTTVKVDRDTHRVIGDLAHLLDRTRGEVVRDAVHAYAAWRERQAEEGFELAATRIATASTHHTAQLASGALGATESELVERSRIGAAKMSPRVRAQLSSSELFEQFRPQLVAAFAPFGAVPTHLARDPRDYGYPPGHDVIVVELVDGARLEGLKLSGVAFSVFGLVCSVVTEASWRP